MSRKEETLDEKIARIRKQNEAIERRKKMIDEEIKDAERKGAIVNLKNPVIESEEDKQFGATLYSDQLSPEKKVVKAFEEDIWNVKPRPRKSVVQAQSSKSDEVWREERKLIDEDRIRRQKANSGWKREWDADKTATSNDRENRTPKDAGNRFDRNSSTDERSENRAYNSNESKGSSNHYNANEEDNSQSRRRRSTNDSESDNRKPAIIRTDVRKTSTSETDKYNNNAMRLYSRNNVRNSTRNTPFTTKNDQFDLDTTKNDPFDGENWDAQFTHDNIATKLHSKSSSKSGTHVAPFTATGNQFKEDNWDIKPAPVTITINNRAKEESLDTKPAEKTQLFKRKPNEFSHGGDVKPQAKLQERNRPLVARGRMKPACGFNNRLARPNTSPNANSSMTKSLENDYVNDENDDSETNVIIPKDLKNIVVQVGNLGITNSKREVTLFGDSKVDSNVPKFAVNLNTSRDIDANNSSGYGSMTFQRSDLKQKITHRYSKISSSQPSRNSSSQPSIATQMFSNSKIGDSNYLPNDANSKSNWFTEIVDNSKQESFTNFKSPAVFEFCATPKFMDFGDIVHKTTTPQDVKIIRTIKNEDITLVREPPKTSTYNSSKRTKSVEVKSSQPKKVDEVKRPEVVEKNEVKRPEVRVVQKNEVENTDVFADNDDESWDDCSDEETEEECGFA